MRKKCYRIFVRSRINEIMIKYLKQIWTSILKKLNKLESRDTKKRYGVFLKKDLESLHQGLLITEIYKVEFLYIDSEEFDILKNNLLTNKYKHPYKEAYDIKNYSYIGNLCQVKTSNDTYFAVFQNYANEINDLIMIELKEELHFDKHQSNYYQFEGNKMVHYRVEGVPPQKPTD